MAEQDQKVAGEPDNPNKTSTGPNKGNLGRGDVEWVTLPPNMEERDGKLVPKGGRPDGSATKGLSGPQKRDLAGRIKAKLRLAAAKKPQ
jgi:hypothetical protein